LLIYYSLLFTFKMHQLGRPRQRRDAGHSEWQRLRSNNPKAGRRPIVTADPLCG
jgi:hypothetical protein